MWINHTQLFIIGKRSSLWKTPQIFSSLGSNTWLPYMTTSFILSTVLIVLWSKKPLNESEPLLKFYRLSIANSLVYSEGYGRIKKRNSYTVAYYKYNDRTTKYGKVLYFFACPFCCCSSCSSGVWTYSGKNVITIKFKDCTCGRKKLLLCVNCLAV